VLRLHLETDRTKKIHAASHELFGEGVGPAEMPFPKTILMIEDDAPTREVVRMACVGQN